MPTSLPSFLALAQLGSTFVAKALNIFQEQDSHILAHAAFAAGALHCKQKQGLQSLRVVNQRGLPISVLQNSKSAFLWKLAKNDKCNTRALNTITI